MQRARLRGGRAEDKAAQRAGAKPSAVVARARRTPFSPKPRDVAPAPQQLPGSAPRGPPPTPAALQAAVTATPATTTAPPAPSPLAWWPAAVAQLAADASPGRAFVRLFAPSAAAAAAAPASSSAALLATASPPPCTTLDVELGQDGRPEQPWAALSAQIAAEVGFGAFGGGGAAARSAAAASAASVFVRPIAPVEAAVGDGDDVSSTPSRSYIWTGHYGDCCADNEAEEDGAALLAAAAAEQAAARQQRQRGDNPGASSEFFGVVAQCPGCPEVDGCYLLRRSRASGGDCGCVHWCLTRVCRRSGAPLAEQWAASWLVPAAAE